MTPARLARAQHHMKRLAVSRPGPAPNITRKDEEGSEDLRIMAAIIMLRKGVSASAVAIDKRVHLPYEQVLKFREALVRSDLMPQRVTAG